MTQPLLAAVLDGQIVVLDTHQARVMVLDPRSERIWRACAGVLEDAIATSMGEPAPRVLSTLRDLAEAGLIYLERGRWRQAPVRWI